jgi:hypothetical protein
MNSAIEWNRIKLEFKYISAPFTVGLGRRLKTVT